MKIRVPKPAPARPKDFVDDEMKSVRASVRLALGSRWYRENTADDRAESASDVLPDAHKARETFVNTLLYLRQELQEIVTKLSLIEEDPVFVDVRIDLERAVETIERTLDTVAYDAALSGDEVAIEVDEAHLSNGKTAYNAASRFISPGIGIGQTIYLIRTFCSSLDAQGIMRNDTGIVH